MNFENQIDHWIKKHKVYISWKKYREVNVDGSVVFKIALSCRSGVHSATNCGFSVVFDWGEDYEAVILDYLSWFFSKLFKSDLSIGK